VHQKSSSFLLENLAEQSLTIPAIEIAYVTNNSRDVVKNTLFLAYPGERADGRKYIVDAITKGAVAIAYEPSDDFVLPQTSIPCIAVTHLKIKQSEIAARFYDFPSQQISVIGVTGTNGKTSVTHFIAQAMSVSCGMIGTLGYGFFPQLKKLTNTTPDGLQLQKIFAELLLQGAKTIAMEVSSHALAQQRVNDVLFHTAVFTNLTQDHLDYHHTMENYRDTKALLFQKPNLQNAVINIDDDAGKYFVEALQKPSGSAGVNVITYALHDNHADISVLKCTPTQYGFDINIKTPWGDGELHLPLIGEFNISNALATIGVLGILKMPFNKIIQSLSQLKTVNGRMQLFQAKNSVHTVVDYAHTPDALEKTLCSIRSHCTGKLWCVFGCGGDRDKTKRPTMGLIADNIADHIIITSDNARSEDPTQIAQDILSGVKNKNKCEIELDRVKAIEKAIHLAQKNDWVLIAGKGHETEQIIGNQVMHHSDVECVLAQIMKLTLLAHILNGTLIGDDGVFRAVSIDSRTVQKGDCFFAIQGEFFDGHDFIADVEKKNAAVIIVDRDVNSKTPIITVNNTRQALIDLARFYRKNATIPIAAITGSCGKTTTRALLENILKQKGQVLASKKSFNNDIGLPLTLLQLNSSQDFAVLEIGTNHPGEIAQLTSIAKPTVATITMVAPVHVEHFGDVDAIAREKGAIFDGLSDDGVAVINADDRYCDLWNEIADHRQVIMFSTERPADVVAKDIGLEKNGCATFTLVLPNKSASIALPLLGEHNITNALAAAAMAFSMGASIEEIKKGLETVVPEQGRLIEKMGFAGALIIDDSYNANPASVRAAIQVLIKKSDHPILVLGDMAELGDMAKTAHEEMGVFAKMAGVKQLFCYGNNSFYTAEKFGKNAQHFDDYQQLIDALKKTLTLNTAVLIKGSRSMRMEKVVEGVSVN